jgi:hypothetical protein
VAHDRNRHQPIPAIRQRSAALSSSALVALLLLVLLAANCGGGSSGTQPPPPPAPTFTTIDAPGAGAGSLQGTIGIAIDAGGDVTGTFSDSNNTLHGFLKESSGGEFSIDAPGAGSQQDNGTEAAGINASGEIAGYFFDTQGLEHSFIRGTITVLDAPNAGTASDQGTLLTDMNSAGVIVGGINVGVVNGVGTTHSLILAADGTYTIFDPPQSAVHSSLAQGINDSGVVVGEYRDANLVRHGYLRDPDGTFVSFDDPNAAQLPLSEVNTGTTPRRMNASGAVTGYYSDSNGARHAFVMQ